MPVPLRWVCSRLARVSLCLGCALAGCGDAHWDSVRWPNQRPDSPPQPVLEPGAFGLAVEATAIEYEPDAIVVGLIVENRGAANLAIEQRAITLAWEQLEYAIEGGSSASQEPAWIRLEPGARAPLRLRYYLGRPLTGDGARLVLRSLTCDDVRIVELPVLELPGLAAR